jgi:RNA polymerase sigma-70 factor (ECF subfamily)
MVQHLGVQRETAQIMPPPDPAALLRDVAESRSDAAYRALFESFCPRVKAYLMRQGADATSAEELAQETLLMVWRKASLFDLTRGSVATWIFTIARNLRIDRLRREVAWQSLPEDRAETPDEAPLQDEALDSRQIQTRLQAVLATLPDDQREVVNLSYLDGLAHSEIAERLGLPLGTVKSRMRLAYQKIRLAFEDRDQGPEQP